MNATSITAAYGPLTQPQYTLMARIAGGEDVRFYSPGVRPQTALRLMERRILDCEAATCRLSLRPPRDSLPRGSRKTWPRDVR